MEVEGQQFHQVVRPVHRAVDPGARPLEHPPLAVAEVEDQQLRLAPLDADLAAVLHALAFRGLDLRADADPPAIDLGDDVLPGHLLARRESTVTEPLQVAGPCRQDLGPQLAGHAVDRLLIEGRPLVAEFVAGQLDRGEQGGQAAHLALQGRGGPLADAQGGQLGIGPGPLAAPALGGARPWGRSRSWRSRRPGRPGGGASAAASPGGVVIGRPPPGPPFSGLGLVTRDRGLGQEAGGHLVGEATEVVVDLDLESSEAGGVVGQSVEPLLLHGIDLLAQRSR